MSTIKDILKVGECVYTPDGDTMIVIGLNNTGFYNNDRFIPYSEHRMTFWLTSPLPTTALAEYKKLGSVEFLKKELKELKAYRNTRPICCPACHRGCFDADKFCGHCGVSLKGVK